MDNWVSLIVNPINNEVFWLTKKQGIYSDVINGVLLKFESNENIHVSVEVVGDSFYGYINGKLFTLMTDNTFLTGKVALSMSPESGQYWDNVNVYSLNEDYKPASEIIESANERIKDSKYWYAISNLLEKLDDRNTIEQEMFGQLQSNQEISVNEIINTLSSSKIIADEVSVEADKLEPSNSWLLYHSKFMESLRHETNFLDLYIRGASENNAEFIQKAVYERDESVRLYKEAVEAMPTPAPE